MFEEQDGHVHSPSFRVNRFDILAVLLSMIAGFFGIIAGTFSNLSLLTRAHSNAVEDDNAFYAEVAQDIERLTDGG